MKPKMKKIFLSVSGLIAALVFVCGIYLSDFYRADMERINAFVCENEVQMRTDDNGNIVFEPAETENGFIFYPGGKVEHTAYIPLMKALASEGMLCILVEMPFRLAVLDMSAAEGLQDDYPEIEEWYIGGHSLGGSMAASYLAKHRDNYEGLVLLGSYSTADLSNVDIEVLSVYGSEDMVLNKEKYDENKSNLPSDYTEAVIAGGCHAYFGMYGAQDGDGTPEITNEEQIWLTVEEIQEFSRK